MLFQLRLTSLDRAHAYAPRIVAILAFALYAMVAPAGFYWLDSAELSAAGLGLGIAHPTGFPLYCVLVRLAGLIPIGELAFRVNLVSAVAAALAVLWVGRLVGEVTRPAVAERADRVADLAALVASVAAAITLAFTLTFFRQATVAEVYAPNAALLCAALLLYHRVARGDGPAAGLLLALVCGLGLAVHTTFLLIGPPVAALLLVRLFRGARWPLLTPLLVVAVAGASYLYLPVRGAVAQPALRWDHTARADRFYAEVTGARIRSAYADRMRSTVGERVGADAVRFADQITDQLLLGLLAAAAGLWWLARRRHLRWMALALGFLVAGDAVYSFWINPMGMDDLQNGMVLLLAVVIAAGIGLAWLGRSLGSVGPYVGAVTGVVLAVSALVASWAPVTAAAAGDLPRAWSQHALDETPPRGIALVVNDSTAAGLLYRTAIEQARPDVAVLVRQQMRGDPERTRAVLRRSAPGQGAAAELWGPRPKVWELGYDEPPPEYVAVAAAPLARLAPAGTGYRGADVDRAARALLAEFAAPGARDRVAVQVLAQALGSLGVLAHDHGDLEVAIRAYDAALAVDPGFARALVNRGAAAAATGDFRAAIRFTERALAIEPNHVTGLLNAARYYLRLDDDDDARRRVDRALALAPGRAAAWALAGILDARSGNFERARRRLERALALDPGQPDAISALEQLDQQAPGGAR